MHALWAIGLDFGYTYVAITQLLVFYEKGLDLLAPWHGLGLSQREIKNHYTSRNLKNLAHKDNFCVS